MITSLLTSLSIPTTFDPLTGVRISSPEVVSIAEMALNSVGKTLSSSVSHSGVRGVSLSGRDGRMLKCVPKENGRLGNVGTVTTVDPTLINSILNTPKCVPIIAPIGQGEGEDGDTVYNVNADEAAGEVARVLGCELTVFLTDVEGVLDGDMKLIPNLDERGIERLREEGVIKGGMIPKVKNALSAAGEGGKSVIADGRVEGALGNIIRRIYGDGEGEDGGGGTVITK